MSLASLLLRRWDRASEAGVMHTNVDDTMRRPIPGELGLVIQFNPSHLKNKRPVDKQLLNSTPKAEPATKISAFNFTKIKSEEVLSGLRFVTVDEQHLPSVEAANEANRSKNDVQDFVLVNVAPLVRGHMLVVPDMNLVWPQKMTKTYLSYALSITQTMKRSDFALGFNSAGAWSSVNHMHLQGYFFPEKEGAVNFPVVKQIRQEIFRIKNGTIVNKLPYWKTTCYVIETEKVDGNGFNVVESAWVLLELLQNCTIPHNLLVVDTVVFIFPRQPQQENGVSLLGVFDTEDDNRPVHAGRLRIAVAELSGLVIAGDNIVYENLTEELFNLILQTEVSLSTSEEKALLSQWKEEINGEMI